MKLKIYSTILVIITNIAISQSIQVTGQWNYSILPTDITEAGADFTGTYTSNFNQVYLDIKHKSDWLVTVQKNNIDWNNKIKIWVHRTGDGNGGHSIDGGINYKRIRNRDINFFSGNKNRSNIPIQYQMRKVSVTIPAHNYIVEIMYTLTNN